MGDAEHKVEEQNALPTPLAKGVLHPLDSEALRAWAVRDSGRAMHEVPLLGGVPTTPDPNTSAKVSRYKWDPYRDANWCCLYYFCQEGHTFAKVSK